MRINYLTYLFVFVSGFLQAQLYVSSNTNAYVYVNDAYLYVKGNVELNGANSNIYLRKDGQLLQGVAGAGTNLGSGALSVYQEGTVNNYQYNYWCSPVGGSSAGGNQPFGITQLGVPNSNLNPRSFNAATILPQSNYNGASVNGAVSIAPYWIWKFVTSNAYAQWAYVGSSSSLAAGQGFTMKGTNGSDNVVPYTGATQNRSAVATATASGNQRYDFRGIPNDGTINVAVATGMLTLTGNPYPSAMDMNLFLTDPTNAALCDGTALYWEHDKTVNSHILAAYKGGYGVYNGTTGVYTPATFYNYDGSGNQTGTFSTPNNNFQRRFAPIGQGFMIRGTANGNVQLKNTHRVFNREGAANLSEFQKMSSKSSNTTLDYGYYDDIPNVAGIDYTTISKAPASQIRINASLNSQAVRQIAIVFVPNAIEGYDRADSKSPDVEANLPFDTYFYLNNTEFVHSANQFNINNKYPLGFKSNAQATFKIQVADFINVSGIDNVYLHDKDTDMYYDIKNNEYSVTLPAGVNNTKYEITFTNSALSVEDNLVDDFVIYQNNDGNSLTIKNPTNIEIASCLLYDVTGKVVLSKTTLGSNAVYEFNTSNLAQGVYIVKLFTKSGNHITKKVEITNKK